MHWFLLYSSRFLMLHYIYIFIHCFAQLLIQIYTKWILYNNMNSKNIWIRQPLGATELFEVECHSWEHGTNLDRYGMKFGSHSSLKHQLTLLHPHEKLKLKLKMCGPEGSEKVSSHSALAAILTITPKTSIFRQSCYSLSTLGKHHWTNTTVQIPRHHI